MLGVREQGYFRGGRRIKNQRRLFWIVLRLVAVDVGESERGKRADTDQLLEGKKPLSPDPDGTHSTQAAIGKP